MSRTTVTVETSLRDQLWEMKRRPGESYNDVIRRLVKEVDP